MVPTHSQKNLRNYWRKIGRLLSFATIGGWLRDDWTSLSVYLRFLPNQKLWFKKTYRSFASNTRHSNVRQLRLPMYNYYGQSSGLQSGVHWIHIWKYRTYDNFWKKILYAGNYTKNLPISEKNGLSFHTLLMKYTNFTGSGFESQHKLCFRTF